MNKDFLKRLILSLLGGSQTDVELTDEDLDLAIYTAINVYMRYSTEAFNEEWRVITLKAGQNFHEIDDDIDFITEINYQSGHNGTSLIPYTVGEAYSNTMLSLISNDNDLQRIVNPVLTRIIYKDGKRMIQSDMIPDTDMNIAARVLTYKDLSALYGDQWIQKYATAVAKMMLGNARNKFQNVSAPNDTSMNGADLISQAQQEIPALEQALFDESVLTAGGIVIG